jgi:ABC-type transport system involved in Fe-S cluster assembly fused permease/ATPase subunit
MKKKSAYFAVFLTAVTLTLIIYLTGTNSSASTEKEIEQTFKNLIAAVSNQDVSSIIKYSLDARFTDDDIRKTEYVQLLKTDHVELKKIIEIKKINKAEYRITAEMVTKVMGATTSDFQVRLTDDGKWKIVIGQDAPPSPSP